MEILMKYFFKILLFSFVLMFGGSCSSDFNLLSEFADENDDDAIIEQAKIYVSKGNYTQAIQMCSNLSAVGQTKAEARYICASAYAGSCGLNTISFLSEIGGIAGLVMQGMVGFSGTATAAQAASCDTAQNLLEGIGTAANRTSSQNMLMVLIGLKKLQVYLESEGDANANNDITDDGIDTCNSGDYLNDTEITSLASALWEVKESAGYTSSTDLQNLKTIIEAACTTLNGVNPIYDYCTAADADTFTANQLLGVRATIAENSSFGTADCGAALGAGCCGI